MCTRAPTAMTSKVMYMKEKRTICLVCQESGTIQCGSFVVSPSTVRSACTAKATRNRVVYFLIYLTFCGISRPNCFLDTFLSRLLWYKRNAPIAISAATP